MAQNINNRKNRIKDLFKANEQSPIFIEARKFAKDDETHILITGESGTGKEVLAQYIHANSPRADMPFIIANIAALPVNLIQSELFGHTKGSFTGSICDKNGLFKTADGGTILLDEIGEIGIETQVALLRFLDYGEIKTVGKDKSEIVDVRVIAATNADLQEKVANKLFREDLYFRLTGATIHLEPLRSKQWQEKKYSLSNLISDTAIFKNKSIIKLTESAWNLLLNYDFRGNYREARNIIERLYAEDKSIIETQDIEKIILSQKHRASLIEERINNPIINISDNVYIKPLTLKEHMASIAYITLRRNKGIMKNTIEELDIDYKTLKRYLKVYETLGNNPSPVGNNPNTNGRKSNINFQKL